VKITDFAGRAVFILEVATGHNPSEGVGDAVLDLPVEYLGVKCPGFVHIRTRKVDKDEDVGVGHGFSL
jgi:hypothetical protein